VRDASGVTVTVTVSKRSRNHGTGCARRFPDNGDFEQLQRDRKRVKWLAEWPPYFTTSGSDSIYAVASGNTVTIGGTIRRRPPRRLFSVGISDGTSARSVTVKFSGTGAGACPTTLVATPPAVTLASCLATQDVVISGGTGTYVASSSSPSVGHRSC